MTVTQKLLTAVDQITTELQTSWPEALEALGQPHSINTTEKDSSKGRTELTAITLEDRIKLHEQLKLIAALPPGQLDADTAAQLGLQLSYATGSSVSFDVSEHTLSYAHGSVTAVATETSDCSVYVSPNNLIPLERTKSTPPWFTSQKVLIINPNTFVAVVGTIRAVLAERLNRYQFGATPELLQAGDFWAPANQGRCVICFLGEDIPDGTVISLQTSR